MIFPLRLLTYASPVSAVTPTHRHLTPPSSNSIAPMRSAKRSLDHPKASFSCQCQLLTLVPSCRSATIQRSSPSPTLAILLGVSLDPPAERGARDGSGDRVSMKVEESVHDSVRRVEAYGTHHHSNLQPEKPLMILDHSRIWRSLLNYPASLGKATANRREGSMRFV